MYVIKFDRPCSYHRSYTKCVLMVQDLGHTIRGGIIFCFLNQMESGDRDYCIHFYFIFKQLNTILGVLS